MSKCFLGCNVSSGNQFEDDLDDFLSIHARSVADWRFTTAEDGIEGMAPIITALLMDGVAEPTEQAMRKLEERMAALLVRAYLAGWDHASDCVRDAGSGDLADQLNLRV